MSQCRAVSERKITRCDHEAIFGSRYCRRHYSKFQITLFFLAGLLAGIVLMVILNLSLSPVLGKWPFFYYLDVSAPEMERIVPDIRDVERVKTSNRIFQIFFSDKISGVDLERSVIRLHQSKTEQRIPVAGKQRAASGSILFEANQDLEPGEFLLEAHVCDKAGKCRDFLEPFQATNGGDIGVLVKSISYETYSQPERFLPVLGSQKPQPGTFWVYHISFHHQAGNAVLKNFKGLIQMPGAIYSFQEIGNQGTDREQAFPGSIAISNRNRIFPDHKWIQVGELDPGGVISFVLLVEHDLQKKWEGAPLMALRSTYFYEAYKNPGERSMNLWVPAEIVEKTA